jgi:cobalamin biosynthesis Mg chelatase CobN
MPKKHPARGRQNTQVHRPQPKHKDVMLVTAPSATQVAEEEEETSEEQATTDGASSEAPKTKTEPAPPKANATKASAAPVKTPERRPQTPAKASAQPARPNPAQRHLRPGQRSALRPHERAMASRAQLVSSENYRYVLKDLRLIGALAVVMFAVIISLTFVVPHLSFLHY